MIPLKSVIKIVLSRLFKTFARSIKSKLYLEATFIPLSVVHETLPVLLGCSTGLLDPAQDGLVSEGHCWDHFIRQWRSHHPPLYCEARLLTPHPSRYVCVCVCVWYWYCYKTRLIYFCKFLTWLTSIAVYLNKRLKLVYIYFWRVVAIKLKILCSWFQTH